jgi:peptidyl-prolyl cis-trans isomerase SurA
MMITKHFIQHYTHKILFAGLCLSLITSITQAQEVNLDRIAAVVNDDVVMLSEVKRKALQTKRSTKEKVSDNLLIKDALESLVLQKVQLQRAKAIGIVIDDTAVNRAMLSIAEQNKLSLPQFKIALTKEGIDYKDFRNNLRDKLYLETLRRRQQNSSKAISEFEVDDLIQSQSLRLNKDVQYQLMDVLVPAPNGISVQKFNRLLAQAQNLRKQLLVKPKMLADPIIKKMGGTSTDLGWKSTQSLSPAFVRTLSLMGAGELSDIVRDQRGFHILKLIAQRGGERKLTQQVRIRHILIPSTNPQAKLKATILRNKILAGEDFATLAKKNSADKGSAQDGGNLGMVDPSSFVPPFAKAARSLPLNSLSQPIQTRFGWHILEVLERKTSDQTRETLKLQAQSLISKGKKKKDYNNWLQGLRDEAFVEYRIKL